MNTDKLKIIVTSETNPTFVFGKKGLDNALKTFWKKKRKYKISKMSFILNLFWCAIIWFIPFSEKIGPIPGEWIRYALATFWYVLLIHSILLWFQYKRYCLDEVKSFTDELKKQPWG